MMLDYSESTPASEFYAFNVKQGKVDRRNNDDRLGRSGIYLIANADVQDAWDGEGVIYIGQAGGRGANATFHDRIWKHMLKASCLDPDVLTKLSVSDVAGWRDFRKSLNDRGIGGQKVIDLLQVRLLYLPNQTLNERTLICYIEELLVIAYERNRLADLNPNIARPCCNTASLGSKFLELFKRSRPDVSRDGAPPLPPALPKISPVPIRLAPVSQEDMSGDLIRYLADDLKATDLYRLILEIIDEVGEQHPDGQPGVYYTHDGRQLRVSCWPAGPRRVRQTVVMRAEWQPRNRRFLVAVLAKPISNNDGGVEEINTPGEPLRSRLYISQHDDLSRFRDMLVASVNAAHKPSVG